MNSAQMLEDLERLKRLPPDWDGEDSPKITEQAIEACKGIIQTFADLELSFSNRLLQIGESSEKLLKDINYPSFLYPGTGGGLSFRWEDGSTIVILPDGAVVHKDK